MPSKMRMISLKPIYEFIQKFPAERNLLSALSDKKDYGRLCKHLVTPIEQCQGFYLWGRYNKRGLWTNKYLGKAGFGKTAHLRSRILKELTRERMCFWRVKYSENDLKNAGQRLHPEMWSKYLYDVQRAFLKAGSTHITWVPTEHLSNDKDILRIEADLIEAMNPKANLIRPAPPAHLQTDTRDIFEQMRICIHEGRNTKFVVKLAG
jgi:hypothetical protein